MISLDIIVRVASSVVSVRISLHLLLAKSVYLHSEYIVAMIAPLEHSEQENFGYLANKFCCCTEKKAPHAFAIFVLKSVTASIVRL